MFNESALLGSQSGYRTACVGGNPRVIPIIPEELNLPNPGSNSVGEEPTSNSNGSVLWAGSLPAASLAMT